MGIARLVKVKPNSGESKNDYMGRCVPAMMEEGKDQDQAVAMCSSMFEEDKEEKKEQDWQEKFDKAVRDGKKPKKPGDEDNDDGKACATGGRKPKK